MNQILKQAGVSLIEILVTTLILGVGLLGVASLQVASVSSNQEGFFSAQATSIAEDLASRIRSSRLAMTVPQSTLNQNTYSANYVDAGGYGCSGSAPPMCRADGGNPPSPLCSDGVSDLIDVSTYDKWDICEIALNTLPQGKVRVLSSGWRLSIVVAWDPVTARSDMGQKQNVNTHCNVVVGDASENCIILEILP